MRKLNKIHKFIALRFIIKGGLNLLCALNSLTQSKLVWVWGENKEWKGYIYVTVFVAFSLKVQSCLQVG